MAITDKPADIKKVRQQGRIICKQAQQDPDITRPSEEEDQQSETPLEKQEDVL